jgi:hypothetical protein
VINGDKVPTTQQRVEGAVTDGRRLGNDGGEKKISPRRRKSSVVAVGEDSLDALPKSAVFFQACVAGGGLQPYLLPEQEDLKGETKETKGRVRRCTIS